MNKLQEIHQKTLERINEQKTKIPFADLRKEVDAISDFSRKANFENALRQDDITFICEVKKASPSKGIIAEDFDYLSIAKEYEKAGAAAISVLTEPFYFLGSDKYLQEIAKSVKTPLLRKDFLCDEYMIYEAKNFGASAVLLIVAMLDKAQLKDYLQKADELGLASLVEIHDEAECEIAIEIGANIIGVNNRNLKTFKTDISTSARIRPMVPSDKIFISESGIKTADEIAFLRKIGANATLIGETFMRSANKVEALRELRGLK